MKMTIIVIAVLSAALALAGVATATISAIPTANAESCKDQFHHSCHGCEVGGQGDEASGGKCHHF
jgi:uncharacterized membrane protein